MKKQTKTNLLSDEALQIAEERVEAKDKGENKRYTHLNAEFQKRARRDKKALSEQRKTIEWESLEIYSRKLELSR